MLGFFTNRALLEHESETAARGAARVYQQRLLHVADGVRSTLAAGRAFDPRATIPPDLEVADKRLMASELSADQWADVLRGEEAIRRLLSEQALARAPNVGRQLDRATCAALVAHVLRLERTAEVLADLAGFDPAPAEPRRCDTLEAGAHRTPAS